MRWSYDIHQDGNQSSFHGNPLITDQLVLIGTDKSCASGGIGHLLHMHSTELTASRIGC